MKVTAAALATLATVASASDFNLRAAATKFLGGGATTDAVDARIAVHGLIHELNDEDMEIVNQSLVSAYNEAYDAAGYSVSSLETKTSVTIPDTVQWSPECRWCPPDDDAALKEGASEGQLVLARLQVGWSPECRWCPPDDDAKSLKSAADLADAHNAFESAFCAKLRNSGSVNMADANTCSLSFLDMPGQSTDNLPVESGESFNGNQAQSEAQITLQGTLHDLSGADFTIIDKSVVAAYNEAFVTAGYSLGSFETVADVEVPVGWSPECRWCPPDDDMAVGSASTLVLARVGPRWDPSTCQKCTRYDDDAVSASSPVDPGQRLQWCCPDDDATAAVSTVEESQLAFMHEAFEKAFCSKVGSSGSANLANVDQCSFRFVYSPATSAVSSQQ